MRLFVAVRLPDPLVDQLGVVVGRMRAVLDGAGAGRGLRWARPEQWHVTLRFLGEVEEPDPVIAALEAASLAPATAELGPTVRLLGRQVVCVPVAGVDALADAVIEATASFGTPPEPRPFRGHVTLARIRGRAPHRRLRATLKETAVAGRWPVDEVELVQSHLGQEGARYDDLHVRRLDRS